MDRSDCCILVNSTPAYYYILPIFFQLLRRYAPTLRWDVILATEVPENPICKRVAKEFAVKLLTIPEASKGFLESRVAALKRIVYEYTYCLPLQDDFLLEMPMNAEAIAKVLNYMDKNMCVVSARCMPCPGPSEESDFANSRVVPEWKLLTKKTDQFGFTFQATLWKLRPLFGWYNRICEKLDSLCPKEQITRRKEIELQENLAENAIGQQEFWKWTDEKDYEHIALQRLGSWPNAVYLSPFPYRPTAIVRGKFEVWAQELAKREGISQ